MSTWVWGACAWSPLRYFGGCGVWIPTFFPTFVVWFHGLGNVVVVWVCVCFFQRVVFCFCNLHCFCVLNVMMQCSYFLASLMWFWVLSLVILYFWLLISVVVVRVVSGVSVALLITTASLVLWGVAVGSFCLFVWVSVAVFAFKSCFSLVYALCSLVGPSCCRFVSGKGQVQLSSLKLFPV